MKLTIPFIKWFKWDLLIGLFYFFLVGWGCFFMYPTASNANVCMWGLLVYVLCSAETVMLFYKITMPKLEKWFVWTDSQV